MEMARSNRVARAACHSVRADVGEVRAGMTDTREEAEGTDGLEHDGADLAAAWASSSEHKADGEENCQGVAQGTLSVTSRVTTDMCHSDARTSYSVRSRAEYRLSSSSSVAAAAGARTPVVTIWRFSKGFP